MQRTLRIAFILLLSGWLAQGLLRAARTPGLARLIQAEVSVDGTVILRASTSDNGRPDADEVWGYLEGEIQFVPTEGFADLGLDGSGSHLELHGKPTGLDPDSPGPKFHPTLGLSLDYGGQCDLRELRLVRVDPKDGSAAWKVDPSVVERWFAMRRITRREAALLEDPALRR